MNTIKNNNRLFLLDNIRGIAFIFMIIHHIFYFYDVSRNYNTSYANNKFVSMSGKIARTIFILLAGYATYSAYQKYSKENKSHIKQRFFKSFENADLFLEGIRACFKDLFNNIGLIILYFSPIIIIKGRNQNIR
jgi:uncharacterized membrane protein